MWGKPVFVQQEIWKRCLYVAPTFRLVCDWESRSKLSPVGFWRPWSFFLGLPGLFAFMKLVVVTLAFFFFFFEQILISGHQPLLVSGNHTAHYTIFHNRYLWKLLAGWHFSVGRSCEQPLGMSWVCYPWDWSTTGKGDMGHCLPSAWKYSGRNL